MRRLFCLFVVIVDNNEDDECDVLISERCVSVLERGEDIEGFDEGGGNGCFE